MIDIDIDMYRFLCSLMATSLLTLSGSLVQIIGRNDLASPSTIGLDAVAVAIVLATHFFIVPIIGIEHLEISSFVITLVLYGIIFFASGVSWIKQYFKDMKTLILIGLGFNLLMGSVFAITHFFYSSLGKEFPSALWFGSFRYSDKNTLIVFAVLSLFSLIIVKKVINELTLFSLGNQFLTMAGYRPARILLISSSLAFLLTSSVISFFGVFSFLGLVFPHMLRSMSFFRASIKRELFIGSLFCGLVVSVLDTACYNFALYGLELPVGMVISVLGSFMLIVLLVKRSN